MSFSLFLSFSYFPEIDKAQKDDGKEDEKFIDVVINKNMKLGQKVLIPVKQFPKVSWTPSSELNSELKPFNRSLKVPSLLLVLIGTAKLTAFHLSNVFG